MLNYRSFIIFVLIVIINLITPLVVFSQERRNPFKDWFPIKVKEELRVETIDPISIKKEPLFNASAYTVEGLIWGADKPKAIINDKIYSLGDKLGEAKIQEISQDGVVLIFANQEYVITTKPVIKIKTDSKQKDSSEPENLGVDNGPKENK